MYATLHRSNNVTLQASYMSLNIKTEKNSRITEFKCWHKLQPSNLYSSSNVSSNVKHYLQ